MSDEKRVNKSKKYIEYMRKFLPFISLFINLTAVIDQIIRETRASSLSFQQFCLLPMILIPNIVLCVGIFKGNKINKYIVATVILNALLWLFIVAPDSFIVPTYLYELEDIKPLLFACIFCSVFNVVAMTIKCKPFIIATLILNIVLYIMVIVYAAIVLPSLSSLQNETIYYSLGYIILFAAILLTYIKYCSAKRAE